MRYSTVSTDRYALIILFLLVFFASSFDYIWVGPLPVWIYILLLGLFSILINSKYQKLALALSIRIHKLIVLCLLFIVSLFAIDVFNGSIDKTFSKVIFLNLSTLILLVVTAIYSTRVRFKYVIYIISFIAVIQGGVCILQYLGSDFAWRLPEILSENYSSKAYEAYTNEVSFQEFNRARGTNLYIHKFNALQGMLVVILFSVLVHQKSKYIYRESVHLAFLVPSFLIGLIGMVLTFSRSTALGFLIVFLLASLKIRKMKSLLLIGLLVLMTIFIANFLSISSSKESNRLTDISLQRETNQSRIEHLRYALSVFSKSPVVGVSEKNSANKITLHSVPLRILVNYGLIGLLIYLAIVWQIIKLFLSKTKNIVNESAIGTLIIIIIDSWTHSSGLLLSDVAQACVVGVLVGAKYNTPNTQLKDDRNKL